MIWQPTTFLFYFTRRLLKTSPANCDEADKLILISKHLANNTYQQQWSCNDNITEFRVPPAVRLLATHEPQANGLN